jgi:hypothetical protein
MDLKKINYFKAGFAVLMAVYGLSCALDASEMGILDRVNIVIHEAGHLLFGWFGEFIGVAGGTIGQLLVPSAFTIYFFLRREFFSSAVSLFWTGQNFFWISVYVKDAQAMALPLLSVGGGEDTIHDWNYLLSRVGLLRWDHAIGNVVYILGILIIIASVVWGFYHSIEREEAENN